MKFAAVDRAVIAVAAGVGGIASKCHSPTNPEGFVFPRPR